MIDRTAFWIIMQKRSGIIGGGLITLLIFFLGWNAGRIMSPYYTSQPIIFQDRECSACMGSGGTQAELQDVKEQGSAQREIREAEKNQVAGASNDVQQEDFVASINSDLFHHISCSTVSRIKPENKVWFENADRARASGRTPSKCTQELGY
jgi:hypothetical protein